MGGVNHGGTMDLNMFQPPHLGFFLVFAVLALDLRAACQAPLGHRSKPCFGFRGILV